MVPIGVCSIEDMYDPIDTACSSYAHRYPHDISSTSLKVTTAAPVSDLAIKVKWGKTPAWTYVSFIRWPNLRYMYAYTRTSIASLLPLLSNAYAGSGPRSGVSLSGSEVVKLRRRGLLPGGQHVVGRGAVFRAAGQRGEGREPHALIKGARSVQRGVEGALKEMPRQVA